MFVYLLLFFDFNINAWFLFKFALFTFIWIIIICFIWIIFYSNYSNYLFYSNKPYSNSNPNYYNIILDCMIKILGILLIRDTWNKCRNFITEFGAEFCKTLIKIFWTSTFISNITIFYIILKITVAYAIHDINLSISVYQFLKGYSYKIFYFYM